MKEKYRILILIIGFLFIAWLGSSIIRDITLLISKGILSNQITNFIVFVLTFVLLILMLKSSIFKELNDLLNKLERKIINKIKR
jgi:hypothetical protein